MPCNCPTTSAPFYFCVHSHGLIVAPLLIRGSAQLTRGNRNLLKLRDLENYASHLERQHQLRVSLYPDRGLSRDPRGEIKFPPAARNRPSPIRYKKVAEADMKEVSAENRQRLRVRAGPIHRLERGRFRKGADRIHPFNRYYRLCGAGAGRSKILL